MHRRPRSDQWEWQELREQLPALAAAWIPGRSEEDLIGRASRSTRPPSSSTATARRAWSAPRWVHRKRKTGEDDGVLRLRHRPGAGLG